MEEHPQIKGLFIQKNIIKEKLEQYIIDFIEKQSLKSITDNPNGRKVLHYGFIYDYKSRAQLEKTEEIPYLFKKLLENKIKNFDTDSYNQLIINRYESKQGISKHIDSLIFGDSIICFSLGCDDTVIFSRDNEEIKVLIPRRSVYIMTSDSRYQYKHEIRPKVRHESRYSLTYRIVK